VTEPTVYKILDWGHDIGFVGRGNQITERGLLLRRLLPEQQAEGFLAGDPLAWNPFALTLPERFFFLYHLSEIDRVTTELARDLGDRPTSKMYESSGAAEVTCRALFRVLDEATGKVRPRELPDFRVARELACTIAAELHLTDLLARCASVGGRRVPKVVRPSARRNAFLSSNTAGTRRTTKNADHQTIPRFEQLVDLGFVEKVSGAAERPDDRRRWRYVPTVICRRWAAGRRRWQGGEESFHWRGFAATATTAFCGDQSRRADYKTLIPYFARAYDHVRRPVGHTPIESVALFTMLIAAADAVIIEVDDVYRMMLAVKQGSLLPDHAFFASGNDFDKMFIHLKPGFDERLLAVAVLLPTLVTPLG